MENENRKRKREVLLNFFTPKISKTISTPSLCNVNDLCKLACSSQQVNPEEVNGSPLLNVSATAERDFCLKEVSNKRHTQTSLPVDMSRSMNEAPAQPIKAHYKVSSFGLGKNAKQRSFKKEYYKQFPWLEYSALEDRAFCFSCRHFGQVSGTKEKAFVEDGFQNWKKAPERCRIHQESSGHIASTERWAIYKTVAKGGNIVQKLQTHYHLMVSENREYIKTLANIAISCAISNSSLRGHDESSTSIYKGIFLEMVRLLEQESEQFRERKAKVKDNAKYTSGAIQNALLNASAECVRKEIVDGAIFAECYGIIADSTRDLSVKEQLSISLRYFDDRNNTPAIHEHFLGFVELSECGAEAITHSIVQLLTDNGLDPRKIVAQSYDTCSVMSGDKSGVQSRIRTLSQNPCYYVHCHAHRLQLVLAATIRDVTVCGDFFDLIANTINFIRNSTVRHGIFMEKQQQYMEMRKRKRMQENGLNGEVIPCIQLPSVCRHKWEYNGKAVKAILQRFNVILETLNELIDVSRSCEDRLMATGLYNSWMSFPSVFLLHLFADLYDMITPLSKLLQSPAMDISAALYLAESTKTSLMDIRNSSDKNQSFPAIWKEACELANKNDIPIQCQPRNNRLRKLPSRLQDSCVIEVLPSQTKSNHNSCHPEACFNHIFKEVYDKFISEMSSRFQVPKDILLDIDACNPKSTNFMNAQRLEHLAESYSFEKEGLGAQCAIVKNIVNGKKLTTLTEVYKELYPLKEGFSALMRILKLALTFPISNTSSERSFSTLKLTKSYLRSTIGQQRLNDMCLLSVEKAILSTINLDDVVDRFAKMPIQGSRERRISLM